MIYTGLNNTGEVEAIYGHLNSVKSEVSEVYGSIDYNDPIFYSRKTLTGTSPLTFKALGQSLKDYHIFGETVQDGTPSPDYPVDVQGVGEWSESILDLNREYYNGFTLDTTKWMKGASSTKYAGNAYLVDATISNGKITVKSNNPGYGVSVFIDAKPNTSYSIFWRLNKTTQQDHEQISVSSRDSNGNATRVTSYHDPSVYTTDNNAEYLNIVFRCRPSYGEVEYSDILVCESDTVVPYGYKIPVTIGNVTTPIYIGTAQTTRKIRKLVLTGEETWTLQSINSYGIANIWAVLPAKYSNSQLGLSSHLVLQTTLIANTKTEGFYLTSTDVLYIRINATRASTAADFKSYLAAQYVNGTPVTIWYVLATPETAVVNEPLHRIGDYADTISMTQAGASIPTVAGVNTLTVDTTVKPSAVSITGNIKPTGYGQLLDVNDVDIQDSTGESIYIQG